LAVVVMTNVPAWAAWRAHPSRDELTIGIEEEFMLLDPDGWSLSFGSDEVLAGLPADLRDRVTLETHAAVMEIAIGVHRRVGDAVAELARLRDRLARALAGQGLRAGTRPVVDSGACDRRRGEVASAVIRGQETTASERRI
jgi:carboxylate-amine ligase